MIGENQTFADRQQNQRSNSVDVSPPWNTIKTSFRQIASKVYFVKTSLHCIFSGDLSAFCKAMRDSMSKTFAGDLFRYISINDSESAVFCCQLEIHKIVKAWLKLPARFFIISLDA